jgi:hypothetical protein
MKRTFWIPSAALFVAVVLLYARTRFGPREGNGVPSPAMPRQAAEEEERALYLTPGGRYTEADIRANGNTTASRRFRGFQARHDFNPRPGDRLCPITRTKANPKCRWIIGGRTYEFCCPPCVGEFVRLAKENPDQIERPEAYARRP